MADQRTASRQGAEALRAKWRISSVSTAQFSLESRPRRLGFFLAFVAVGLLLAGEALRVGVAAVLSHSFDLAHLERALALDPGNTEIHCKLGAYYLYSLQDLDVEKAINQFRLATRLSPLSDAGWSELANACDVAGSTSCADQALERALELSPRTPRYYWDAALHFVATRRPEKALPYCRRFLALDPGYAAEVFRLCPELREDSLESIARQ